MKPATLALALIPLLATLSFAADDADLEQANRARLKEVTDHMMSMPFSRFQGTSRQAVAMIDHALLAHSDPVRANVHGTVWAWGQKGRPLAVVEVFQPAAEKKWVHAITLTSTNLVELKVSARESWLPQMSAIDFQTIPSAGRPADREPGRLAQMKNLARKFEAFEFWDPDNSRYELRLLVQPIHRYEDAQSKIVDGAVFVLSHGTNPEIVLLIEAQGETVDQAEWRFAAARLGSAELHLMLDGKDVWTKPRTPDVVGKPIDPYWLFVTDADQKKP